MTPLGRSLIARIAATGPISLADYMADCLLHPVHGYYATRDPLGAAGDFTTAPEISQMFGELLGLWLAQCWLDQGAPAPFTLAEPGPGRGTLMADVLRATKGVPGFHAALRLWLVEASPTLRARQKATLSGWDVTWADSLDQLPETPLFLLANEFLDALPIRQFRRSGDLWQEVMVGTDGDRLMPGLATPGRFGALEERLADTEDGGIVEICPALPAVIAAVSGRIARHGGAALFVDYGDWQSRGDTFQAVRDHTFADPFADPGEADLTAHVDFAAIAAHTAPARATGMITQGALLARLGIDRRTEALATRLTDAALERHMGAYRRLTHPQEMGSLFKAIAIVAQDAPTPPGFDT